MRVSASEAGRHRATVADRERACALCIELPAHLQRIALFKVNTGCRKQEVLQLRWNWEVHVPELETSVFILPSNEQFQTKNGQERDVVLNSIARRVIDEQRGKHPEFVFAYKGKPTRSILNSGWKLARIRAGATGTAPKGENSRRKAVSEYENGYKMGTTALGELGNSTSYCALPEVGVTLHTGDMGDTFPHLGESHALEGVSRRGRTSPFHCPLARR